MDMSFKTTVNGLFNDMQCYLVIVFVIIGVFQQTVGRVIYCILKKGNMWQKSFFFSDNAEWSSKNWWKIISANVKWKLARTTNKRWWLFLTNLCKRYLQNLKYNVYNEGMYFWFNFGRYFIYFDIVCLEQGGRGRGVCLTDKIY